MSSTSRRVCVEKIFMPARASAIAMVGLARVLGLFDGFLGLCVEGPVGMDPSVF
jgi:hypothetical protein